MLTLFERKLSNNNILHSKCVGLYDAKMTVVLHPVLKQVPFTKI